MKIIRVDDFDTCKELYDGIYAELILKYKKIQDTLEEECKKLQKENEELKERLAIQKTEFEEEIEALEDSDKRVRSAYQYKCNKLDEAEAKLEKIEEECKNAPMCDSEFSLRILEIIGEE